MYFVEISSQAFIVLKMFVSYVLYILLYTYVCMKLFRLKK